MLENKKVLQLVISAVLSLIFVNFYLRAKEQSMESGYGMVEVLIAARDIGPHTAIKSNMLSTKQIPIKYVEPGAFRMKIPGQATNQTLDKVTISAIPAGAQILQSNLNDALLEKVGIAPLLPPGKVGYLLRLGNTDVSQLILPGDHINILATFAVRTKDGETKATYTILQNILVVSVGRELRKPDQDVTSKRDSAEALMLSLALEPDEAERMEVARANSQGEISVVVRAHGNNDVRPLSGVTASQLVETSPRAPTAAAPAASHR